MKTMTSMILAGLLLASPMTQAVEQTLPAVLYISSIDSDELYTKLKETPALKLMDKENVGNPLRLVVNYKYETTAGGEAAGFTSALLAGSSLGILPVVTNSDLVLTYELRVHGELLTSVSYRENFTKAQNMYSNQGLYTLDKDSMAWVMTTVDKFAADIQSNPELKQLIEEYNYYFGQ
ncbi:hypothetical protein JYB88_17185 [Shewanella cyperi]|uniref:Uncharacterized protein n=1 Tax=Shewanella cyperi TaxID=2814292 RepID=A0A974XMQ7_9GAMM|nr:hypothetical protein [Shewanella cyperi]QSX29891.1 hypothetical protein JYB88_17185 [Shewanella cyperi]